MNIFTIARRVMWADSNLVLFLNAKVKKKRNDIYLFNKFTIETLIFTKCKYERLVRPVY